MYIIAHYIVGILSKCHIIRLESEQCNLNEFLKCQDFDFSGFCTRLIVM